VKGLVIRSPWIDKILSGEKTWEMRSRNTKIRGQIALIRAGSGQIFGTANLVDCLSALSAEQMRQTSHLHGISELQLDAVLSNGWTVPWVLRDIVKFPKPIPYPHPSGAVTWVDLSALNLFSETQEMSIRDLANTPSMTDSTIPILQIAETQKEVAPGESWVDIPITRGNIQNNHFYLRSATRLLPGDCIGGSNKKELAAKTISVRFDPGPLVDTDIAGDKMILRARSQVGDFFERSGARSGDSVRLLRQGSHKFLVTLMKAS
jgi:hypothetical protein